MARRCRCRRSSGRCARRGRRAAGEPEILGYADKYVGRGGHASCPPRAAGRPSTRRSSPRCRGGARVAALVSLRGVARLDFLADGDELVVNEINTIPGSLARYLWIDPPVPFATLLGDLVDEARARPTHAYSVAGADGLGARGAASIAAKLA